MKRVLYILLMFLLFLNMSPVYASNDPVDTTDPELLEESDAKEQGGHEEFPDADERGGQEECPDATGGADVAPLTLGGIPSDDEEQAPALVSTEEELADWCYEYWGTGKTVMLDDTITITSCFPALDVVIDTGAYGLVYDGGYIDNYRNLMITGEGVDVPVVDVIDLGLLWGGNWNNCVQEFYITATGKNGIGGIALRVCMESSKPFAADVVMSEGQICSYGTGAIGLYMVSPLDVYCLAVEVSGENSTAVYAKEGINLFFCKLKADGEGARVAAGNIVLDTCTLDPVPQNAQVINRRIIGTVGRGLYQPVKQHGEVFSDRSYNLNAFTFILSGEGEFPARSQQIMLDFDDSLYRIDTSVLGDVIVPCTFVNPQFEGLGLEDDFPLDFIVSVQDPSIPCISMVRFWTDLEDGSYMSLEFWDTYERDDENLVLWRSDDGGKTWYDFTDSPDIEWCGSIIYFNYDEITSPIALQLEYAGKESNVVTVYSVDGNLGYNWNGDRDGDDRTPDTEPANMPKGKNSRSLSSDIPDYGDALKDSSRISEENAFTIPAATIADLVAYNEDLPLVDQAPDREAAPADDSTAGSDSPAGSSSPAGGFSESEEALPYREGALSISVGMSNNTYGSLTAENSQAASGLREAESKGSNLALLLSAIAFVLFMGAFLLLKIRGARR